ncbi:integrase [Synergistales bacterium]|nr:integrase [Synergistales bacterium]
MIVILTDTKIKNLKPSEKRYSIADGDGLYIETNPNGKKYWRFRVNRDGRRNWFALGEYPMVSIREARELRDNARRRMFDGLEPKEEKEEIHTFEAIALEWYKKNAPKWSDKTQNITIRRLEMHIFPFIGSKEISSLKAKDLLSLAQRIEASGTIETTRRVMQICSQVFRFAIPFGHCEYDPVPSLRGSLAVKKAGHFAGLTKPSEVAALLRAIDVYPRELVRYAMRFSAYTFCRPGEIRHAEWTEFSGAEWRIPAEKMKMKRPHIVPLSRQAIEVLDKIRAISGHCKYLFPSSRAPKGDRPMSDAAVLVALRALGYSKEEMTAHGFRSMASTLLNEHGFKPDVIERQLAHIEGNSVRAAYNYAEYMPERREMMQWWADYLDGLRNREKEMVTK